MDNGRDVVAALRIWPRVTKAMIKMMMTVGRYSQPWLCVPLWEGEGIAPILELRKLRSREVRSLVLGSRVSEMEQDANLGCQSSPSSHLPLSGASLFHLKEASRCKW